MKRLTTLAMMLLCCALVCAQGKAPERKVHANVITSEHDPRVRIELPKQVQYVGADRWVLYGVADCEIHLFVEADAQKNVRSYYWVQFEGFIPSKPESQYRYPLTQVATLGGMTFDVRARVGTTDETAKPGSDLEHVQTLLREKGYRLPAGMMNVRLVHVLDESRRRELMIIYAEDVKPTGFAAPELYAGGRGTAEWPAIQRALIERAEKKIVFRKIAE